MVYLFLILTCLVILLVSCNLALKDVAVEKSPIRRVMLLLSAADSTLLCQLVTVTRRQLWGLAHIVAPLNVDTCFSVWLLLSV